LRFDDEFIPINANCFDVFPEGGFLLVLFQFLLEAVVELRLKEELNEAKNASGRA